MHMKDSVKGEILRDLALVSARSWHLAGQGQSVRPLLRRAHDNYGYIFSTYKKLQNEDIEYLGADEWLLDNFYIVEQHYRGLTNTKNNQVLPVLASGRYEGLPRVYAIAAEIVSATDGKVDEGVIYDFICAYQSVTFLTDSELWALSGMLQLALIARIREICTGINRTHAQYREAAHVADEIVGESDNLTAILSHKLKHGAGENASFVDKLLRNFKKKGKNGAALLSCIDKYLENHNLSSDIIIGMERQNQIKRQVSIGNAITSLKSISTIDYKGIFEKQSQIEMILQQDPAGVYPNMCEETKQYYRKRVDKLSKKMDMSEIEVCKKALSLANSSEGNRRHIGYFLLNRDLHKGNKKQKQWLRAGYVLTQLLLTLLIAVGVYFAANAIASVPVAIALALLAIIPASDIAINLANYMFTKFTPVAHIPRMEEGTAPTLVVISTLLTSAAQARHTAELLEGYYLSNKQDNLIFGILSDYPDSNKETDKEDAEILKAATKEIDRLNSEYGRHFCLFHRKRVYNAADKKYMGWERKRGAIAELVRLIKGSTSHSFVSVKDNSFDLNGRPIKYIITLDADTCLPIGAASQLVAAMQHPLNQPVYSRGKIISGYGLMQPHIAMDIDSVNMSPFSKIFAGVGGVDAYSGAISDIYQDLYGEAIYTGKGIFDIDTFYNQLDKAIPVNKILSHDLLEGSYIRTGLIGSVPLIDGYPSRYTSYVKRLARWIRGDWLLLPWLMGKVKNAEGRKVENPLSGLSKWKIIDNLRRSVLPIFMLAFMLTAAALAPSLNVLWLAFIVVAACNTLFISLVEWFSAGGYKFIGQRLHSSLIHGIRSVLYKVGLLFMAIPHAAWYSLCAIANAIKCLFTGRGVLNWTTAAQTESKRGESIVTYYSFMLFNLIAAAALVYVSFAGVDGAFAKWFGVAIAVLWVIAPAIMYAVSKPVKAKAHKLADSEKQELRDLAQSIWNFFEDFMLKRTNYLVPDNYQVEPPNNAADRTSPTNIGLQLMAIISAHDLGFIDQAEMLDCLTKTVETIEKLEKWNGHIYNWYETDTLRTMRPRYISTVDSGNFAGYLITVAQRLSTIKEPAAKTLEGALLSLFWNMDFGKLYDKKKHLFTIGYNIEEEALTNGHYDLLASENRQASFVAIAKGDVPKKHWFTLGRALCSREGFRGMISWTGTMFEYLMPLLIMKNVENTLLSETYSFVLRMQKRYGRQRSVPWGTSESGFFAFDNNLNYQYKAFGVPDLGLKRGLSSDMVVAPYATIMALMVDSGEAMENLARLNKLNVKGEYGYYEAIDYTPSRVLGNEGYSVVKSYMVHHLGMSLLSINNVLNDNILCKRFHSIPIVKATEQLLKERVPLNVIIAKENMEKVEPFIPLGDNLTQYFKEADDIDITNPVIHALGSNALNVTLTDSGLGYVKSGNTMITRWRNDNISHLFGNYIYVKNVTASRWWTTTLVPAMRDDCEYFAYFTADKAEYHKSGGDNIDATTEITTQDNAMITRLTLANHTDSDVTLEVTTYQELVLTSFGADISHPAFSNLFIRTEYNAEKGALFASRRPRVEGEAIKHSMHAAYCHFDDDAQSMGEIQYETDRAKFIGRGGSVINPAAMQSDYGGGIGSVIDPIMSLRIKLKLAKGSSCKLAFVTAYSEDKESLLTLAEKYKDKANVDNAFKLSISRARVENKYLGINAEKMEVAYAILSKMVFISPKRREQAQYIEANTMGQQNLWKFGISGDNPIALVTIDNDAYLDTIEEMLIIHDFWRMKGVVTDLVIICKQASSYLNQLRTAVSDVISLSHARGMLGVNGGVFVLNEDDISPEEQNLLLAVSGIVLKADSAPLQEQLVDDRIKRYPRKNKYSSKVYKPDTTLEFTTPEMYNGIGGFQNGGEYVIGLKDNTRTPLPWVNVVANPTFGFVVTESGGGYTYCDNSRENKLTPWHNDAVTENVGECIYIRDDINGEVWTPTPEPIRHKSQYIVKHGFGYTEFKHQHDAITTTHTMFVPMNEPVKINMLHLENNCDEPRTITLVYYVNPILGVGEHETKKFINTTRDGSTITAINNYNHDFYGKIAFYAMSEKLECFTCDKDEFFGRARGGVPDGMYADSLSEAIGCGYNPCVAMQTQVKLPANGKKTVVFLMGEVNHKIEIAQIVEQYANADNARNCLSAVKGYYSSLFDTISVKTPDEAFNIMANGRLLYQTLVCRIWARGSLYQSGGAYGYRDQLQDTMALLMFKPEVCREQIIRCAAHQYIQGDVQHWWHPKVESGIVGGPHRGVRTRFSDDLLWLPYVVCEYVTVTGDYSILDEVVPYLEDYPLEEGEDERYREPNISDQSGDVFDHCVRAIEKSLIFGRHGLPLMGSGDWNDGMNTVGNKGKGESVWLAWFLCDILNKFSLLCDKRGEWVRSVRYRNSSETLAANIDNTCWDGAWYRRAYFDDGSPLGSAQNLECKIDAIAQSWAVISGMGKDGHTAMQSVLEHLVSYDDSLIKLLTPPFDTSDQKPGYIKGYLPGVRENGGQYTHAACWVVLAFTYMGMGNVAGKLFNLINPINHARTPIETAIYKTEPYAVAADVYAAQPHVGRGGWTWYTGASGWLYRVAVEGILGIKKLGDTLLINPCLPDNWQGYEVSYRHGSARYNIIVSNNRQSGAVLPTIELDGAVLEGNTIPLADDSKTHKVSVSFKSLTKV